LVFRLRSDRRGPDTPRWPRERASLRGPVELHHPVGHCFPSSPTGIRGSKDNHQKFSRHAAIQLELSTADGS